MSRNSTFNIQHLTFNIPRSFERQTMLLNYQDLSPVKKSIEVEIPADLISSESRRVADEFGRHAKIPGFRPGKVPAQVVRTRFAKEIQDEVMSRLLPLTFREAIADRGVEPVGGTKPGQTVSFEKVYGEDANNETLRGKNVHHEVALKEIRVQEKPEVDDEFAKAVGGWEGVAQMREAVTADIRRHRELEVRRKKQSQIGELLLAAHDFDVPEVLVDEELGKSMQNYARFLASQGIDVEKAEIDWQKVRDDFLPEAVKRVKRGLILEAIAKQENVQVSDVEVDAEIRRAANEAERDFAEVSHRLMHDGGYEHLGVSLAQEKP